MYKILPILLFAYGLAVTTSDIYDNSYALIIGIDKYKNNSLDYAVKDAESVASILKDRFNFNSKNIKILLDEEETLSNIKNSLSEIASSAEGNDRVLVYFAGHGITDDLPDGGEMGYLLPIDGKVDNLFATSIPMDDFKRISSISSSKHMLFLIDACYGGLSAVGARGLDQTTTPNFINKITASKSRQIITAGGRDEKVIEKSEWGHSAFTMNLIRGLDDGNADLNDDGFITADELGLFLKEKVTIDSNNQQTPQSRRFTTHEGEFIFINNLYIENQEIKKVESNNYQPLEINYDSLATLMAKKIDHTKSIDQKQNHIKNLFPSVFISPTISSLRGNETIDKHHEPLMGFSGGIRVDYNLYKNIFLTSGIHFERKGSTAVSENQVDMDDKGNIIEIHEGISILHDLIYDYITFPLTCKVYLGEEKKYFIDNGFYYSHLIDEFQRSGAEVYSQIESESYDFGIILGLGINIFLSEDAIMILSLRNNFGLHNTSTQPVINDGTIKHNSFGLVLSIGLPNL